MRIPNWLNAADGAGGPADGALMGMPLDVVQWHLLAGV
jgi:hypothetical protein